jgi:hypothetical protein
LSLDFDRNLERTGGCQCGAVRFRAKSLLDNTHVCHCRMCQKASGNFFAALVGVPLTDFAWTRGEAAAFRSSALVQRGFCRDCGTPLFFRHDHNQHISMSIGAFDDPKSIPLAFQLGMEGRVPQVDQFADLKDYGTTEEEGEAEAAAIKAENRQHPDHDTEVWPPARS